jgi:hypothetical protein
MYAAIVSSQEQTRMASNEPKFFQHLTDLYKYLDEEGEGGLYSGSQRRTFDRLNLSNAMNPILFRTLREMGCIEMVQRGAGSRPTILKLIKPPQIEQFREWNLNAMSERALTTHTSSSSIQQQLRLLERRLPQGIDLPSWILGIEDRLAKLEAMAKERHGKKS